MSKQSITKLISRSTPRSYHRQQTTTFTTHKATTHESCASNVSLIRFLRNDVIHFRQNRDISTIRLALHEVGRVHNHNMRVRRKFSRYAQVFPAFSAISHFYRLCNFATLFTLWVAQPWFRPNFIHLDLRSCKFFEKPCSFISSCKRTINSVMPFYISHLH